MARVGTMVAAAHAQDFERRRPSNYLSGGGSKQRLAHPNEDSSDEDEDGALTSDEESGSTADFSQMESQVANDGRAQMHRIAE